ncbi:L,D-transpeptidase [Pannonibacter tanglangensis]|nr:L,D-transpeptidase [Pannonibacter sp. XCT-53]
MRAGRGPGQARVIAGCDGEAVGRARAMMASALPLALAGLVSLMAITAAGASDRHPSRSGDRPAAATLEPVAGVSARPGKAAPGGASGITSGAEAGAGDPLHIVVSLQAQSMTVYRGLEPVAQSPISSGKPGHGTPTGVYSILEKRRKHFSNIYDNAPMPYMQRLTWSGIALHQGKLPGYPASHGCVRMPMEFAQSLFGMTERGAHVVITDAPVEPVAIRHAALPRPYEPGTAVASLDLPQVASDVGLRGSIVTGSLEPARAPVAAAMDDRPLRMIITPRAAGNEVQRAQALLNRMGFEAGFEDGVMGRRTRDAIRRFQEGAGLPATGNLSPSLLKALYRDAGEDESLTAVLRIRRNFKDIYEAPVALKDPHLPLGTMIFTALGFEPGASELNWVAVNAEARPGLTPDAVLDRISLPPSVARDVGAILTPGSSLIVTDRSFARNTGLGTDFVVTTR